MRIVRSVFLLLLILTPILARAQFVVLPSDIGVQLSASPTSDLSPGDQVSFRLSLTNHGPAIVTGVSLISTNYYLEFDRNVYVANCPGLVVSPADDISDPHYNLFWFATTFGGPFAVGETRHCDFALLVTSQAPQLTALGFGLSPFYSEYPAGNPNNNAATVLITRGLSTVSIPATSTLTLIVIGALVLIASFSQLSRRIRPTTE
ncbi:hypothetical protein [Tahibacter amnicola]|uniref:DUF11 domain-containing protein n=1 Tax=Tahibacter amnicola TaxID=2976241 RepID=A0ABY6BP30_9GAMM|nr:hypothetical protein [Tahibacter amnicola]UXI70316.1 hypothetical protein N4264_11965 [Tahibacter amnicola]